MSKKTYRLNISGGEIGDNLVRSYDTKKELLRDLAEDASDFLKECGVNPESDDWYPYFEVEDKYGEFSEISFSELTGRRTV
jgi:hypothetical protein